MLCGKSHKIIPILEPIYMAAHKAHALSVLNCQNPTVENSVDLRVAIENIIYKIDRLALYDAGLYNDN